MIYIPSDIDLTKYKVCFFHEDEILLVDLNNNYLNYSPSINSHDFVIYNINTCQYSKFSNSYIPSYFFDNLFNRFQFSYTLYDWDSIPHPGQLTSSFYNIYGIRSSDVEFTNNIYYSPKFPQIFICGFINLLIIIFLLNGLTRIIFKGGIFFHK